MKIIFYFYILFFILQTNITRSFFDIEIKDSTRRALENYKTNFFCNTSSGLERIDPYWFTDKTFLLDDILSDIGDLSQFEGQNDIMSNSIKKRVLSLLPSLPEEELMRLALFLADNFYYVRIYII